MKYIIISLVLALILVFSNTQSHAGWLVYHKPEFKGRVLDAESKEPIEGAVVVVAYNKYTVGPFGRNSSVIEAKETLTDKNGEFYFPAYTTLIQPFSGEDLAEFIIFKPGYGNFPNKQITPKGVSDKEAFFSKEVGSTGELAGLVDRKITMIKVTFGIVELPKLKSREERRMAMPSPVSDISHNKQKLLIQLINKESRFLGLKGNIE